MRAQAPAALLSAGFVEVRVAAIHPEFPAWSSPVTVCFRRAPGGWQLVGLTR
jgi:hypothetical protein